MEGILNNLTGQRKQNLFYYSPYNFLRELDPALQFDAFVKNKILKLDNAENRFIYEGKGGGREVVFLYENLTWDSNFLRRPCYKLFTVLYADTTPEDMVTAVKAFKSYLIRETEAYIFIDIPAEDIFLIQCLTGAGFKLVETRLHFFKENIRKFQEERFPVRKATPADAEVVAEISRKSRNEFDRLHADFDFSDELADDYLAVYARAAVNGFCDTVLLPAEPGLPVDAFLAINHVKEDSEKLHILLARIVLTAVGAANKGWHKKLVSETVHYAGGMGAAYVLMTTQATNRAVFRTCEKLNFKLGSTSHILSFSS